MKAKKVGATLVAVGLVAVVGGFIFCTENVKPGYVGIVYSMNGGIKGEVLGQGRKIVMPWEKLNQYSSSTEQAYLSKDEKEGSKDDDSFMIPTSDGKTVDVDLEFSYHFDLERLPETFTRFKGQSGKTIEETFIRGKMKAWAGEVSSTYSVIDIYGEKRSELNGAVLAHTQDKFNEYGIIIDSVNFTRIALDAATEAAIQSKINKQQEVDAEKLETQKQAEVNARNEAAADSKAKIKVKDAEAAAEANAKLQENLDADILTKMFLEKWDGILPQVSGGSAIMDMREKPAQ